MNVRKHMAPLVAVGIMAAAMLGGMQLV